MDDTLPGVKHVGMEAHLRECTDCARHDASVRRSLLLFRNLPHIEPSRDFALRLDAKLDLERRRALMPPMPAFRGPGIRTFMAAAGSVVAVGLLALANGDERMRAADLIPPAAVALEPATLPSSVVATPAFVTTVSMGMPVWPALLIAEDAPVRFVASELSQVSWGR